MNCDDVRRALADRLDGLLTAGRTARLDAHLKHCETCVAARERLAALRERVYAPLPVEAPAEDLRERIVERAAAVGRAPRGARRLLIPCAASFAAGVLITLAVVGRRPPDPSPTAAPAPVEIQKAQPVVSPPRRRIL